MNTWKLEPGSPADYSNRIVAEQRCYELLDSLNVEYYRVDHAHADTMEECREVEKTLDALICKNLFLCNRQQTDFYLLMIPGDKVFKTKDLSKQIGSSRLSFAGAEHMESLLDVTPGSVTVLGLMNDSDKRVQLLVDEDVLACDWVGCHPCINTSSLKLRREDMFGPVLAAMGHEMRVVHLDVPEEETL
jgi:Ala-tRNA(Pro) deacylase